MKKNEYVKTINLLSMPILMNYLISSVFELIDKAIVGHYSASGFAAIGIAASVIYTITGALGILSAAYNIVAARSAGEKNDELFTKTFFSAMLMSITIGGLFIILSLCFGSIFFKNIYGLKGNILHLILEYFYPASITVLLDMIIFIFSVYFRNKQNTKISVLSTFVATLLNIFFDYVLVYGKFFFPSLGVSGAAWGSVLGLLAGIIIYVLRFIKDSKGKIRVDISRKAATKMLKLYVPLFLQELMLSTVFTMIITIIVSRLGTLEMAVYSLLDSLGNLIILPVYAYSAAAVTLALQKKAAKNEKDVKLILKASVFLSLLAIGVICTACVFFKESILGLIVSDKVTVVAAKNIIIFLVIPEIINIFYQVFRSYLQGIDFENYVFITSTVCSFFSAAVIYLLARIVGIKGIYLGLSLNYIILSTIYFIKVKKTLII